MVCEKGLGGSLFYNKMTTILGIHLCLLGFGAYLLVWKAMYFGGSADHEIFYVLRMCSYIIIFEMT